MKKLMIGAAALALMASPVLAGDYAAGHFSGGSSTSVHSSGLSVTGGLAAGGMDGFTSVRNESGAAQLAGARSELTFTEVDTYNASTGTGVDGVGVTVINESFVDGYDFSETRTVDNGVGTAGLGVSIATRAGDGWAAGSYFGEGSTDW